MAECPGIYRLSLMRDGAMARVRMPGGRVNAAQIGAIGDIARDFGNGLVDLTNRANLQIRGLCAADGERVAECLGAVDLLCDNPDVERLRNITASPLAGMDASELVDVTEHVAALDDIVQAFRSPEGLSVKFAFVVDGGGRGTLRAVGHDIGFFATRAGAEVVFEVSLAGARTQLGIKPGDLRSFVDSALQLVASRGASRVRDVLESGGTDAFLEAAGGASGVAFVEVPERADRRTASLSPGYNDGCLIVGVPLARLTVEKVHGIADLARSGDDTLRLTPWQSIVFPNVPSSALSKAEALGFDVREPAVHVVACAGASGCVRTNADTKADGLSLRRHLAQTSHVPGARPLTVHLSGCPRGCAMPGSSDILALAQPESANYALHAGSRPAAAATETPDKTDVSPAHLATAIGAMISTSPAG